MRLVWAVIPLVLIGIVGMQESFALSDQVMLHMYERMPFTIILDVVSYLTYEMTYVSTIVMGVLWGCISASMIFGGFRLIRKLKITKREKILFFIIVVIPSSFLGFFLSAILLVIFDSIRW